MIFWLAAFIFSAWFAGYHVSNFYEKWQASPVIISYTPADAKLSSIPFPAVTICSMNSVKRAEAEKIKAEGDPVQRKLLDDICNNLTTHDDSIQYTWPTFRQFLIRTGSSCSEMLKICEWSGRQVPCEEIFSDDLTDEGLCCSFNRLPPTIIFRKSGEASLLNHTFSENIYDWDPDTGFRMMEAGDKNTIPRKPAGAGDDLGLTVVLDAKLDDYYCSSTSSIGFKIIMMSPIETPKMAYFGSFLSPGLEANIALSPYVQEASDKLKKLPLEQRRCYFANENRLVYYRKYSKSNCQTECLSQYIYRTCNCVPYFLPKNSDVGSITSHCKNGTIRYCEQRDDDCVVAMTHKVYQDKTGRILCDCYPSCNDLSYKFVSTFAYIKERTAAFTIDNKSRTYFAKNAAIANFYFPSSRFTTEIKEELYEFTEILANAGGLLGLCLGFSFISIFEILYFISLRLICNRFRRYPKARKNVSSKKT